MRVITFLLLLLSSIPALVASENDPTCAMDGTCNGDADVIVSDQDATGEESTEPVESDDCTDDHVQCESWASREPSHCDTNRDYMKRVCRMSCKVCVPKGGVPKKIVLDSIDVDLEFDMGEPQLLSGSNAYETRDLVKKTIDYMRNEVLVDPKFKKVREHCKNRHHECAFWASVGECEANPNYMTLQCAPSCQTCDKIAYEARCPMDNLEKLDAWEPGSLNKMFERITTDKEYQKYNPKILSCPEKAKKTVPSEPQKGMFSRMAKLFNATASESDGDAESSENPEEPVIGPWVIVLDDFISPEECDKLIELGGIEGYERSADVGDMKFDGTFDNDVNDGRTSLNAWCRNDCYEHPTARNIMDKIANLTGIPELNSEYLQLLKYDVGQFYHTHHDYIPHQLKRQSGVRLLTVFLYLNDVEEGGATDFPTLHIAVKPKRGRALIWPSVMDSAPNQKDSRTHHQALPVKKGTKYGANAWVHMRDFKTPNNNGCT